MAVTSKIIDVAIVPGSRRQTVTEVALDTEYEAGGEKITAAEIGLSRFEWGFCLPLTASESETVEFGFAVLVRKSDVAAVIEAYSYKSQKVIATGKDLSKIKVLVIAYGK
jgi:hypothetical protein